MRRAALVVLGLYVGLTASVVHRHGHEVAGIAVPWGLALAVMATVGVALGAQRLAPVGAAWFGMGWAALLLMLQQVGSQGSYLVAGDALGWSFMGLGLGGIALVVVCAPRLER